MSLITNCTPLLVLLLACVNLVSAEVYYVGPTIGGIVGLVSKNNSFFFVLNKEYLLSYFLKIVLILDIIAAVEILRSAKPVVEKLLWILFIIFCPIIGKNKL
jgi:hypothetical protein